ncbi:hypothetical protein BGZ99_010306, partial [Dissophora globulifera]
MTHQLYQQFRQADKAQKVSVRTLNIPGTSDTSPYFLSLKDIRDTFPNAQYFELNGQPISFLPDHDGTRPQCIAFYPDKILDVLTDEPQSDKSNAVTHDSTRVEPDIQNLEHPRLTSSSLVPFVAHNVEQTTIIKSESHDLQGRMLSLLLKAEMKEDKLLAQQDMMIKLQLEAKVKNDKILALQMEAKEKDDKMLALQQEAKQKDDK